MTSCKPLILLISLIFVVIFSTNSTLAETEVLPSVARTTTSTETELLEANPIVSTMSGPQKTRVRNLRNRIKKRGCRLKICFLLEGSRFIGEEDFTNQKNFADLLLAITTTDTVGTPQEPGLSGATYARGVRKIIPRLTTDRDLFLRHLDSAKLPRRRLRRVAHAGAALRYALNLFNRPDKAKAAKILLFGKSPDLRMHVRNFNVRKAMETFRSRSGTICGVSLDKSTTPELQSIVGDESHVVSLDGFFDIAEIIVATVATLCEVPCRSAGNGLTSAEMSDLCPK